MTLTPDSELDLLFDPSLIPGDVKSSVSDGLHIRPLASTDRDRGHLSVLEVLTRVPDPGAEAYLERFKLLQNASPKTYYVVVILDANTDTIVAVGTVFLEFKFIRGLGSVGHIEDIAVNGKIQGRGLGKKIIQALTGVSEQLETYKVILDCSEQNVPFYERCEYKVAGAQMSKYAPNVEKKH